MKKIQDYLFLAFIALVFATSVTYAQSLTKSLSSSVAGLDQVVTVGEAVEVVSELTAPVNTVAPAITGTGLVGNTLAVSSTGTWTGNPTPTLTCQWQADGVDIGGATSCVNYTLTANEQNDDVTLEVEATNSEGTVTADSNIIGVNDCAVSAGLEVTSFEQCGTGTTDLVDENTASQGITYVQAALMTNNRFAIFYNSANIATGNNDSYIQAADWNGNSFTFLGSPTLSTIWEGDISPMSAGMVVVAGDKQDPISGGEGGIQAYYLNESDTFVTSGSENDFGDLGGFMSCTDMGQDDGTIACIGRADGLLARYEWDAGSLSFSTAGTLTIAAASTGRPALTYVSATAVAIAFANGDKVEVYDHNNDADTWAKIGTEFSIPTSQGTNNYFDILNFKDGKESDEVYLAYVVDNNNSLQGLLWNSTSLTFSSAGSSTPTNAYTDPIGTNAIATVFSLAKLNDTTITLYDAGNGDIEVYKANDADDSGIPRQFQFVDKENVTTDEVTLSSAVQLTNFTGSADISISTNNDEQYRICSDSSCNSVEHAFTSASGTVVSGEYVQLRLTADSSESTSREATLTVASVQNDTWSVTTAAGASYSCSAVSSFSVLSNVSATDNAYKMPAAMTATAFALKENGNLEWWTIASDTPSQLGSGTATGAVNTDGICKIDSDTVALIDSGASAESIRAFDHDGDGTFTEDSSAETAITAFAGISGCDYIEDNKILVYNANATQIYDYVAGSGFTADGNSIDPISNASRDAITVMSATRFALHNTDSSDSLQMYLKTGSNWATEGNTGSPSNSGNGHYGICGLDEDTLILLSGADDEAQGWSFDGTDWAKEGTDLADSAYWDSWPRYCTDFGNGKILTATWGEPDLAYIDVTCN